MTLDELNVAVNVSAEEALRRLDELIEKARTLGALGEGFTLRGAAPEGADDAARAVSALGSELARASEQADEMSGAARDLERRFGAMSSVKKNIQSFRDLCTEYKKAASGGKDATAAFDKLKTAAGKLGLSVDASGESIEDCRKRADALEKSLDDDAQGIATSLGDMLSRAQDLEAELNIQAAMGVDVSQPLAAIQGVISVINALLALMGRAGISASGGSGGGGGGGGGSRRARAEREAEEAARAAEEARKEAIRADYDLLDHRKHINELTLEAELRMLDEIRAKHRLTAEEIMEWERRVYDVKQEIRERDAKNADALADSVIDAITARYEAMRDAELTRLDDSRRGWEKWRDDSVKAIEAQIAALDRLADTEDREAADQKELRRIASLRQQIEFEQDEYNRAKLTEQLEAAIESREARLRRLALADQKSALQDEITRIDERMEDEISALDKQTEAAERAYEERLRQASLEAEAQKLIMQSSQSELLELLGEFAPEYGNLGRTLGERMADGFREKVGDIVGWFDGFNKQMAAAQASVAASLSSATDAFYAGRSASSAGAQQTAAGGAYGGVSINQTTVINQPVETPTRAPRRRA